MLTNFFIAPHPLLQVFVDNYVLCTSHNEKITLSNTWPASNETSLVFYMCDSPYHYTNENVISPLQHKRGCVIGLQSCSNGLVYFNGVYHTFMIQFKANGFYKLFGWPADGFLNKLDYLDNVFGNSARDLDEALQNAEDLQHMANFADQFLLYFLNRQKKSFNLHDGITFISNELSTNNTLLNVEQYAYKANMSVRNFGRRFTEQVGVSPKLYCRLLRFNKAMTEKMKRPQTSWTSIAYECGYYDQMHMIKDFKEFANVNPSVLFENSNVSVKTSAGVDVSDYKEFNTSLTNEEFVFVKRTLS